MGRKIAILAGGIALLLGAAYLAYTLLFPKNLVMVASADGMVEIESGGIWIPVKAGEYIPATSRIRTADNSKVVLAFKDNSKLTMEPGSELKLEKSTGEETEIKFVKGKIASDSSASPLKTVKIVSVDGGAAVNSKGGSFTLTSMGGGSVAIVSNSGDVKVDSGGTSVALASGEQSKVFKDAAPTAAKQIPASVTLEPYWPSSLKLNLKNIELAGPTDPGAKVRVNGIDAPVDREGKFKSFVMLEEGENVIKLEAKDVFGNSKSVTSPVIEVSTKQPELEINTKDPWKE